MSERGGEAAAPREIELKLDCAAEDLGAVAAHPLLRGAASAQETHLVTTYFDTPAGDLRAADLTLRIRSGDGRHVQTVKAGSGGVGLFDRAEWEADVSGDAPEPAAWAGTAAEAVLAGADGAPRRLFATVMRRRVLPVTYGCSQIRVTLDEGRVEADGAGADLCEVELETDGGRPADLFGLAQALAEAAPLRLGVRSKSARGFALLDGTAAGPTKAGPIDLPEGASAAEVFRRVARACLRHMRLNEIAFLEAGRHPDALHQMRVALRRLRSAIALFAPILERDPRAGALAGEIKDVTAPFGSARNLDVFLREILPDLRRERPDADGLADLAQRAEAERERAYDAVLAILESPQWRSLLLDLAGWIEAGPWAEHPMAVADGRELAGPVLERARRRLKKRSRRLGHLDAEARHRARIAGKKLRYGADFLAALYPKPKAARRHEAFAAALKDLQDHLGLLNDRETAGAVSRDLAGPELAGHGRAALAQTLGAASEARERLLDVKPFWR